MAVEDSKKTIIWFGLGCFYVEYLMPNPILCI